MAESRAGESDGGSKASDGQGRSVQWLADYVYGSISTLVAIAGLTFETNPGALTTAGVVVVGAVAIWLAHTLSRLVLLQSWQTLHLRVADVVADLRGSWSIVSAALPATVIFTLAGVHLWSVRVAFALAEIIGVLALAVVGIGTTAQGRPIGPAAHPVRDRNGLGRDHYRLLRTARPPAVSSPSSHSPRLEAHGWAESDRGGALVGWSLRRRRRRGGRPMTEDRGGTTGGPAAGAEPAWTEAELTELALAADPDAPVDADAVPLAVYLGEVAGLLPEWYMPTPMLRRASAWRVPVVMAIVAAFVFIEALGLCSTFGQLVPG